MPREFKRNERVADFIRRELALIMQQELSDPRLSGVNINDVEVSRDISQAKVYVTFLSVTEDKQLKEATEALNNAAGFLRSQLAARNSMRSTPKLKFFYDESVRTGEHISRLIDEALSRDSGA